MNRPLSRFAWAVLAWNVLVILWGAYVRATGSGAGCGAHWPLCNGQVIPEAPGTAMLIEFSHRLTSGLALLAVIALAVWVWRALPRGHQARRGAAWSVAFILSEAAVGAGLVLFRLVADNASMARAMFMAVHLVNTFALLGALTLTVFWVSGGPRVRLAGRHALAIALGVALAAMIAVGKSGAVAALGDTLYPPASLAQGLAQDLSTTSHLLIRLRLIHPLLAVIVGIVFVAGASRVPVPTAGRTGPLARRAVPILAAAQVVAGFVNVWLLAPVWMQMVHLLLADALWIALVLLSAAALAEGPVQPQASPTRA